MNTNTGSNNTPNAAPVALITGGAQRIGASIATALHRAGYNLVIHYRRSQEHAEALTKNLNAVRSHSAICIQANLQNIDDIQALASQALAAWQRIDALINNASSFYPTPIGSATETDWDALVDSNMKAPFFLAQALAPALRQQRGCIINMADIYAEKPLPEHTIYCMAKAGNVMLTRSLARELAPDVRVNGIAPGAILWPETTNTQQIQRDTILRSIPLQRAGHTDDIANTVLFLLRDAAYITGHIITVDGGRHLHI